MQAPRRVRTLTAADTTPAPPPHPLAVPVAALIAAAGIVLDQATKLVALRLLEPGRFVPLLGDGVGWQLVENPGAAFGLRAPTWVFLVVAVLVVTIVVRSLPHAPTLLQASAYGLLLSGAIGNMFDRVLRAQDGFLSGKVVDFVAWGNFPRFNAADSWITIGFALLVIALLLEDRRASRAEQASA
ncbi:signal peptidase II [Nitriliruptor alkaliphilus]|uniref:signal peptidase II n=1 Tax=Nitriliruptor alkaliphilus TaxID=427918 RepID=UPI0014701151|nr:signal peptidase II [Nitriliruptor alkaliphilus]